MQTSVNNCTESLGRSVQKDILKLDPSAKKQNSVGELPVNQAENLVSSVAQSRPTLCDPVNRSAPGLPVHHQLPESTQAQVR